MTGNICHDPPADSSAGDTISIGNSVIPVEAILSYPSLWPPTTVFAFLRDTHNNIKDDKEKAKMLLDNDPQSSRAINGDWVNVLDQSHWKILKTVKTNSRNNVRRDKSANSVVELLRLIRNKTEHSKEFDESEKCTLGWFTDGMLDQHKFVVYWTSKFPHFLPFIWRKFYQLKLEPTLTEYYISHSPHVDTLLLNVELESLGAELIKTLNEHKENGGLLKRYKCNPEHSCTLEFRILVPQLLSLMTSLTRTLKVEISEPHISCTWINSSLEGAIINEFTKMASFRVDQDNANAKSFQPITLFIDTDFNDRIVKEFCTTNAALHDNVIFLARNANSSKIQRLVEEIGELNSSINLLECEYKFDELSSTKQMEIVQRNVVFQKKEVQLQSLLPKSYLQTGSLLSSDHSLLNWVGGDFFHELITNSHPSIFKETIVPNSDFYIVRRIISRGKNLTSKILRHLSSADIILVTNISYELLKNFCKTEVACGLSSNQGEQKQIVWLESEIDGFKNIRDKVPKSKNCQVLKYIEEDSFQWLRSHGSVKLLQNQKLLDKTENSIFEDDFISQLIHQKVRLPVIIADKPEMGKSWLLMSLAEKISKLGNHFVIFIPMNDFMKELFHPKEKSGKCLTKTAIINAISNFVAETTAEKILFKLWADSDISEIGIKCEIMFDGMDEVTKYKVEAKKVLKILCNECPFFRPWITVRDYMLEDLEELLGVLGHKIVSFEETDQVRFLRKYWQKELGVKSKALCEFAKQCTKSLIHGSANKSAFTSEIAGIPLQCRMVAEVYKSLAEQISNAGVSSNQNNYYDIHISLTDLYSKMIDKKLEEYLRKGNPNLDLASGFVEYVRLGTKKDHWYLAIKLLFPDIWADKFSTLVNGIKAQTIDRISEIGLIQKQKPLTFVHRTFAEYFIALFVFEIITSETEIDPYLQKVWAEFIFEMVLDVVADSNPVTASTEDSATFRFPVICYFLNAMLQNRPKIDKNFVKLICGKCHDFQTTVPFKCKQSVLLAAVRNDFLNIFRLLFKSVDLTERDKFLGRTKSSHDTILSVSVKCSSVDFFKHICTLLEDWYMRTENVKYQISKEHLYTAIRKGRFEIVKFLVLEKGFGKDTWVELQKLDKDRFGLLHHCVRKTRGDKRPVLEEKKRIIEFLTGLDKSVLELRDNKGRTPLLLQIDASIMLKRLLVEQGADVTAVHSKYGNTGLHWHDNTNFKGAISARDYHELLEIFIGKENNFNINTISSGNTPLHCAIKTYYDELKYDSLLLFQQRGADSNLPNENGETVLHLVVTKKNCNLEFIEKLLILGSNPHVKNKAGNDALALASGNSKLEELIRKHY